MRITPLQENPEIIDEITVGIGDADTRTVSVRRIDKYASTASGSAPPTRPSAAATLRELN